MKKQPPPLPAYQVAEALRKIYRQGLTTLSGGNASVRDKEGRIWVSPSQVDKGRLQPEDVCCFSRNGEKTGKHSPSSEWPFHRIIYRLNNEVAAVLHAHPPALVALSLGLSTGLHPVFRLTTDLLGATAFCSYSPAGSEALGEQLARKVAEGYPNLLLQNHGIVITATTMTAAVRKLECLESFAQLALLVFSHSGARDEINRLPWPDWRSLTSRPSSRARLTGNQKEAILSLKKWLSRAIQRNSCSPFLALFSQFLPEDGWVYVFQIGTQSGFGHVGLNQPTSSSPLPWLAPWLFPQQPRFHSVGLFWPIPLMAWAWMEKSLPLDTMAEVALILQGIEVRPTDFEPQPSHDYPGAVVPHLGLWLTGKDPLSVLDKLEVAGNLANSLLLSNPLNPISHLPEEEISHIRKAWNTPSTT
jgi:L-fuculose-phosphate aldolase